MKNIFKYVLGIFLLTSCETEGLMDTTDLDELTTEKIYSDVEYTRKVLYDLYGRMREETNANNGSFSRLMNMNTAVAMLDNATDDGAGNTTRSAGLVPGIQQYITV